MQRTLRPVRPVPARRATLAAIVRDAVRDAMPAPRATVGAFAPAYPAADPIMGPESVVSHPAVDAMRGADREVMIAIGLSTRNAPVADWVVGMGSINACVAGMREIYRPALVSAQAVNGVILVHNHPSGDPSPSPEDIALTKRAADVGKLLGVEMLDHVIVTGSGWYSLKEHGAF